MKKRMISTELQEDDNRIENSLRPKLLSDYVGQEKIKNKLKVYMKAAKLRGESLDHACLLPFHVPGKACMSRTLLSYVSRRQPRVCNPA